MLDILIRGAQFPTMAQAYKTLIVSYDGKVYEGVSPQPTDKKKESIAHAVELPEHGDLIDRDALTKEINERIDAAIKWGVNAIADRDAEIKLRAEQAVATFCEASLAAKKLPTIVPASKEDTK